MTSTYSRKTRRERAEDTRKFERPEIWVTLRTGHMGDERPETWVTLRTGHMGYTFRPLRREVPMPWKETSPVEERLRFVARLLEGEAMAALCREFCISRKTGYKIFERYKEHG